MTRRPMPPWIARAVGIADGCAYAVGYLSGALLVLLGLFITVDVLGRYLGGVYSGAWAYPESCGCCGRSLWYGPMELAVPWAQYAVEARSEWAREIARREGQIIPLAA